MKISLIFWEVLNSQPTSIIVRNMHHGQATAANRLPMVPTQLLIIIGPEALHQLTKINVFAATLGRGLLRKVSIIVRHPTAWTIAPSLLPTSTHTILHNYDNARSPHTNALAVAFSLLFVSLLTSLSLALHSSSSRTIYLCLLRLCRRCGHADEK